jgi:hypothetical protein
MFSALASSIKSIFGPPPSPQRQLARLEISGLQQELIQLGRWLDSGACTADDETSLKEAIVYIKGQIRELGRV